PVTATSVTVPRATASWIIPDWNTSPAASRKVLRRTVRFTRTAYAGHARSSRRRRAQDGARTRRRARRARAGRRGRRGARARACALVEIALEPPAQERRALAVAVKVVRRPDPGTDEAPRERAHPGSYSDRRQPAGRRDRTRDRGLPRRRGSHARPRAVRLQPR